jgi:protein-tyrosine-phosphatase
VRFLCSGNVVRSAFAELYARHLGCPRLVDSAATTYQTPGLFPETVAALKSRGVANSAIASFVPRQLALMPVEPDADLLVLGMTGEHLQRWAEYYPDHPAFRVERLVGADADIADPVMDGADWDSTFERVAACVEALLRAWDA